MIRRRKKGSISYYQKKCDELFSAKIRSRGKCERCGKRENLACAHIVGRRNMRLRWDEENAVCLCYRCHIHWAHKEPLEFTQWIKDYYPGKIEYLVGASQFIMKRRVEDYLQLMETLK